MAAPQRFHWFKVRATAHATEDPDRVAKALQTIVPAEAAMTPMESHHGGHVVLLESELTRQADIRKALALDAEDQARLHEELDRRVDEDGVLYFRFEKQAAFLGKRVLTQGEDAIQCRVKIEVHPTGRERALAAWTAWLGR